MERRTVLASLGIGMATLAGCSSSDEPEQVNTDSPESSSGGTTNNTDTPTETETETDTPSELVEEATIGQVVSDDQLSMVVRDVSRTTELSQFNQAEAGNTFVVVRLAVKNRTSGSFADFSSFLQTTLTDGENYNYDPELSAGGQSFSGGQLAPGEVVRGDIAFEVPEDAGDFRLQFDFSAFSFTNIDQVLVDLDQSASSMSDVSQSLQVELYEPGDAVEYSGTTTTVNSVEFATSVGGNYGPTAEDGMEFAIVDISVQNNTGEEQSVSTLLQMGMKDGQGFGYTQSITATSQLDQDFSQGSPIPDGETRRGKVAYSVPADADQLYWTFEFSVFADGDKTFWQLR